ncbi:enoyl-CoA hydratase/isomerase family protein, partial [Brevirhabdus pacifica]
MTEPNAHVVEIERDGPVALISFDNPPVNAASQALRQGLDTAIRQLADDDAIEVIALYGKGRSFIAGADIREFGKPPRAPGLTEVCNTVETCAKPVISVLHGVA